MGNNSMIKTRSMKLLAAFLIMFTAMLFMPHTADAATEHSVDISKGNVVISTGSISYYDNVDDGSGGTVIGQVTKTLTAGDAIKISGSSISASGSAANTIKVESGSHNITLNGVTIDARSNAVTTGCAFSISANASVNLNITGINKLYSSNANAGIYVPSTASLTISGDGSLLAESPYRGAGIGANSLNAAAGTITIKSGTVTAVGGECCAGIGGSYGGGAGTITIENGSVTATGGDGDNDYPAGAAGIGCGSNGSGGDIIIKGGTVTATGGNTTISGATGPGIGCNASATNNVNVTVKGGTVTANGGTYTSVVNEQNVYAQGAGLGCGSGLLSSDSNKELLLTANGGIFAAPKADLSNFNAVVKNTSTYNPPDYTYETYGNAIAGSSFTLNSSETLNISKGCSLTIPPQNGWIANGYIFGSGDIINYDKLNFDGGSLGSGNNLKLYTSMVEGDVTYTSPLIYTGSNLFDQAIHIKEERETNVGVLKVNSTTQWECTITDKNTGKEAEIINVGTYNVYFEYYDGTSFSIDIVVNPASFADINGLITKTGSKSSYTYTGDPIEPEPTVKHGNNTLEKDVDYTVTYSNNLNVGEATVTVTAVGGNYVAGTTSTKKFNITKADLGDVQMTFDWPDGTQPDTEGNFTYDGTKKEPGIVMTYNGHTLTEGTDYQVAFTNKNSSAAGRTLIDAGEITATVTPATGAGASGNYTDSNSLKFKILQRPLHVISATSEGRVYEKGNNTVVMKAINVNQEDIMKSSTDGSGAPVNDDVAIALSYTDKKGNEYDVTGTLINDLAKASENAGTYSQVQLEDLKLTGAHAPNYKIVILNELGVETKLVKLTEAIEITQAEGPAAPVINGSYETSKDQLDKFTYTIKLTDADGNTLKTNLYEFAMVKNEINTDSTTPETPDDGAESEGTGDSTGGDNNDQTGGENSGTTEGEGSGDAAGGENNDQAKEEENKDVTPAEETTGDTPAAGDQTTGGNDQKTEDEEDEVPFDPEKLDWKDGAEDGNIFDGIEPNGSYTFYARAKETTNYFSGDIGIKSELFKLPDQEGDETFTMKFELNPGGKSYTATIPTNLGGKNVVVEYSFDGETWETLAENASANKKTDCFPGEEYTGWVKYVGDSTHSDKIVKCTQKAPLLAVEKPVVSPNGGTFVNEQKVTITTATKDATIYYTLDGTDPLKSSSRVEYKEPFTIDDSTIVMAAAVKEGQADSEIVTVTFTKGSVEDIELGKDTKLEVEDFLSDEIELSEGLKNSEYDTKEKVTQKLTQIITSIDSLYTYLNMAYYDITIYISTEDGSGWIEATPEIFPKKGVEVTIGYPPGTSADTHNFAVSHMFSSTSERLGTVAGETEEPSVKETDDGLTFKVTGTSPLVVAWQEEGASSGNNNLNNNGSGNVDTNGDGVIDGNDSNGTNGGASTAANGTNADGTSGDGTSGDGTADGEGGALDTIASALGELVDTVQAAVQTGDFSNPVLWGAILVVAALLIIILIATGKKKKHRK